MKNEEMQHILALKLHQTNLKTFVNKNEETEEHPQIFRMGS